VHSAVRDTSWLRITLLTSILTTRAAHFTDMQSTVSPLGTGGEPHAVNMTTLISQCDLPDICSTPNLDQTRTLELGIRNKGRDQL
jgi:hypothetical protein